MTRPSVLLNGVASTTDDIADSDGRHLTIRRMHALDKLRLFKAVGPELAQNQPYLGLALLACSVTAIDGVPVPVPVTEAQIEALVSRLGDAGMTAVAAFLEPPPSDHALRTESGNSAGTPI
jgi:hypothetical protein